MSIEIEPEDFTSWMNLIQKRFDTLDNKIDRLAYVKEGINGEQWLDSQDVCDIIRISKRQLQTYRENGKLGFSQIGHKIYYRPSDVQKFIDQHTNNTLCQK